MKTTTIGGTTVLTNGQGFTLYWLPQIPRARSASAVHHVADTGPGQANGNNLNLNGGLWREVTMTR